MKNSILILGISLLSLINVCNANNTVSKSVNLFQTAILTEDNEIIVPNEEVKIVKPSLIEVAEEFNPENVISYNRKTVKETIEEDDKIIENTTSDDLEFIAYEESMKKIIAQSDLIIENTGSNVFFPLYIERTIEDEIAEMELIIESTETNEVSPLDFRKINKSSIIKNTVYSKRFVGMN
jgi:hypothetical protein